MRQTGARAQPMEARPRALRLTMALRDVAYAKVVAPACCGAAVREAPTQTEYSMPQRTVAVFDLGGVLVDWDPRNLYRKLFANDEAAMEHFLAHVCSPA